MEVAGYRVGERVGDGATAVVFRGHRVGPPSDRRPVDAVIKVARPTANPDVIANEFARLSLVQHPALPQVIDVGRWPVDHALLRAGAPCLITAWFDGVPLAEAGPTTFAVWVAAAWQAVDALRALARVGLCHGDVSPRNLLLRPNGELALIDLGQDVGGGTVGYAAPERWCGDTSTSGDVFALAATLIGWMAGGSPFATDDLAEFLRQALAGPPPMPAGVGNLGPLLSRMLAPDPAARPSLEVIAHELEANLAIAAPTRRPPPTPTSPGGRFLPASWIRVIATTAAAMTLGDARVIQAPAGTDLDALGEAVQARRRWQTLVQTGMAAAQVDDIELAGFTEVAAARRWLAAGAATRARLALLASAQAWPAAAEVVYTRLPDLDADDVARWWSTCAVPPPPSSWLAQALQHGDGRADLIETLLRAGATSAPLWAQRPGDLTFAGPTDWYAQLATLAQPTRQVLALLAALGGAAERGALTAVCVDWPRALAALPDPRWVALGADGAELRGLEASQVRTCLDHDLDLVLAALARCDLPPRRRATAHQARPAGVVPQVWLDAARDALAAGANAEAERWAGHAVARAPADAHVLIARARLRAGDYAAALAAVTDADHAGAASTVCAQLRARLAQLRGDLDGCAVALQDAGPPDDPEVAGLIARLAIARGDPAAALTAVARAAQVSALGLTARGLAHYYQGDFAAADAAFAQLAQDDDGWTDPQEAPRARVLRAMVAQARGALTDASAQYRAAAELARQRGDVHAAAIAEQNAATAQAERGHHGEALGLLARAVRRLALLDADRDRGAAEFNRATSLAALGLDDDARAALDRAGVADGPSGSLTFQHLGLAIEAHAHLLAVDLARRAGDLVTAQTQLDRARATAADPAIAFAVACVAAEVDGPSAQWPALRAQAPSPALGRLADQSEARSRVQVPTDAGSDELIARLSAMATLADAEDRGDLAWRAWTWAAVFAMRRGASRRARAWAEHARALHDAQLHECPDGWRAAALTLADRRLLDPLLGPEPSPSGPPLPGAEHDDAQHLLTLARELASEATPAQLYERVMTTAMVLVGADRGFLWLAEDPDGTAPATPDARMQVIATRNMDPRGLDPGGPHQASRSIAARACQLGGPIVTVDAGVDLRFAGAQSIAASGVRSVVAAPLRHQGRAIGCVYLDHRLRRAAFDDASGERLQAWCDLAVVAIDNARLTARLRAHAAEIEGLNEQLARQLDARELELARLRAARPPDAEPAFAGLIGTSPAMHPVLAAVAQAARSHLPVVIVGESGTGKEVIARAIHAAGARAARPFVAINCGALPDTLLETELFGHRRGAFSGADRDRAGLFEIADGGTLLLDEVADMPPAMQAKLLRVLEAGELRRVGDTALRTIDVRVIAASPRPLGQLVAAGTFRDDLRYRLEVLAVTVPPLRERDGDLEALIRHIAARRHPDLDVHVSRAALRALARYPWPGNVRELENVLARAVTLSGGVIDVEDLPDHVGASGPTRAQGRPMPEEDLTLRTVVDQTERAYVAAALARTGGNASAAARLLGLSRFGLQKKMKRLGL